MSPTWLTSWQGPYDLVMYEGHCHFAKYYSAKVGLMIGGNCTLNMSDQFAAEGHLAELVHVNL